MHFPPSPLTGKNVETFSDRDFSGGWSVFFFLLFDGQNFQDFRLAVFCLPSFLQQSRRYGPPFPYSDTAFFPPPIAARDCGTEDPLFFLQMCLRVRGTFAPPLVPVKEPGNDEEFPLPFLPFKATECDVFGRQEARFSSPLFLVPFSPFFLFYFLLPAPL